MNTLDSIKKLCGERGISIHKLEMDLGFSNGSLSKAKSFPFDRIVSIAEYFNVNIDYFLLESYNTAAEFELAYFRQGGNHPFELSKMEKEIILSYRVSSDDIKAAVCAVLGIKKDTASKEESVSNL